MEGELVRAGGERTAFSYVSARLPGVLGSSPFYRRLFDGAETPGLTAASLGAHLEASLPQYMIPASFTALDKIPLTANGKVDRQALKDGSLQLAATAYTEPRTDTERRLITIWQTLLGIDRIGSEDDFFQCGGHSLLAMRMIYFVKKAFGVTLSIKTLFELRTVAQLSELLDSLLVKEDGESVAYDIIEL